MRRLILTFSALAGFAFAASAGDDGAPARVVSIGGAITEIVYALGAQDRLVARDSTSTFPREAQGLPDAGYMRALSAEGVMAMKPDLVLAIEGAGPPEQLAVLQSTGVRIETIPEGYDGNAIADKIRKVGVALGKGSEAEALATKVARDLAAAAENAGRPLAERKRVLFILSIQDGRIQAAGRDTSAEAIIRLAGGENAVGDISGYKAITPEALAKARPDVILMMARGQHAVSAEQVFADPALALTPAARSKSLIVMDGLHLLGFGPRTADAVRMLSISLYGPRA